MAINSFFVGNYLSKRIANVGFATICNKILPKLVTWDNAMSAFNDDLRHEMSLE